MFVMRQLKALKLSQIKIDYVNILSAKFDFEKMKQNKGVLKIIYTVYTGLSQKIRIL